MQKGESTVFQNKIAVVTGAGGTLCSEIAIRLAEAGATVILVGRTEEKLQKTAEKAGKNASVFPCDVTDRNAVEQLAEAVEALGGCDFLINGAGGNNAKAMPTITQYDPRELTGELPEEQRAQFPFKEGKRLFRDLPPGVIEAPNAEHHSFTDSYAHICAPGSAFASGTFDARNRFQTMKHGYNFGSGEPWRQAVDRMLDALIVPDGGGVTVNHPTWSRMKDADLFAMLDHDPRVLGIEVYNYSGGDKKHYPWSDYWSENYWDRTLATGRQCFGFSVPDWAPERGVNILVVPEKTVEACLRAYRRGDFYFGIFGGIVSFTHISFDGRNFKAGTDKPVRFELVSRRGKVAESTGMSFKYRHDKSKNIDDVYLRLKAYATDDSGEIIFSQPMMLS
jgi:hypothetical protein